MELESMKNLWEAHEKELKKVVTVNDQLLNRIISDKSHNSLEKIKNTEYLIGSLSLLFFALFLLMGSKVGSSTEMIVSYAVTITAFIIELALSVFKLRYLSVIDFSAGTVTDMARKTQWFKLFITRERLISILSLFIVAPAVYILVFQWVKHENALDHLPFTVTEIIVTVILGVIFSLILYRRAYLNHLHTILTNLKEIEEFKTEP
jgi:hypothetical protein